MKLNGKVAIITGASSGMGRAMALQFAKEGATVLAVARRVEKLQELVEEANSFNGEIEAYQGDVSNKEDIEGMVRYAVDNFGKLDILVNNAGVIDQMMPVHEVTDELWEDVMKVNIDGPMMACRSAIKIMLKQGFGNIINVASVGGLNGCRAGAAYTASKFAIMGLTKNIGFTYAQKGIRCNAICPGGVETEIGSHITAPSPFGMERAIAGLGLNPRNGKPEEIAKIAVFLASDDSSFVNGTHITADSGWTAY